MNPSNESSDPGTLDLSGLRILIVEDSWHVGTAMTRLLEVFGAAVIGPVATSADAQRFAWEQPPDAALVDFNLRGGELADGLIDWLHELGIYVIVITGYTELPRIPRHAVAILHKPLSEEALFVSLRPVLARKAQGQVTALLRDAIAISGADMGNIQFYDSTDKSLAIVMQQGFKEDFLRTFERVSLADGSACARAMRAKLPTFIPDVSLDADFAVYRAVAQRAGFASVLSMPLVTDSTEFVGVLSVHFVRPQAPNLVKLELLSEYARHAANALAGISRRAMRLD